MNKNGLLILESFSQHISGKKIPANFRWIFQLEVEVGDQETLECRLEWGKCSFFIHSKRIIIICFVRFLHQR